MRLTEAVTDRDLYETPGEALLHLTGLSLFVLSFILFIIMRNASPVGLALAVVPAQIGILLQYRIENRIARRCYPDLRWWQRIIGLGETRVRKELWRPASVRRAVRSVRADPRAALRTIPPARGWTGTFLALCGIGLSFIILASS